MLRKDYLSQFEWPKSKPMFNLNYVTNVDHEIGLGFENYESWHYTSWTCTHCQTPLVATYCERNGLYCSEFDVVDCPCCGKPSVKIYSYTRPEVKEASQSGDLMHSIVHMLKEKRLKVINLEIG